jgi:phosphoglycerate dehydrogenase-like enzyme
MKNIILMYSTHAPSKKHIANLRHMAKNYKIVIANSEKAAIKAACEAKIIFGHRYLRQCLPYAKNLIWVQTTAQGIDRLPHEQLKANGIMLSRTTVASKAIARYAYTLAWALIKRLPSIINAQTKRIWAHNSIIPLPQPKTALILGFGEIGKNIAALLKKDSLTVWAVKRTPNKFSKKFCDKLFTNNSWRKVLRKVDICFVTLPLSNATRNFFDAAALQSLPKHAVIVDISHGGILNEKTLVKMLRTDKLGGAALDVMSAEQPKHHDEIWSAPNLLISPHIAAHYPERTEDIEFFFEMQLRSYLKNGRIKNIVNWR